MFYIAKLNRVSFPDIIDKCATWHEAVANREWWTKKTRESYTILRDEINEV